MIGNDVIDLALADRESNWQRKGFLDKIFTAAERRLILSSESPQHFVWDLWSRKEAVYKIYHRETARRVFNPLQIACYYIDNVEGEVRLNGKTYFTKTEANRKLVHTIATVKQEIFSSIRYLNDCSEIEKIDGIPFLKSRPVSISHHGRFNRIITVDPISLIST